MTTFNLDDDAQLDAAIQVALDPTTPTDALHTLLGKSLGYLGIQYDKVRNLLVSACLRNPNLSTDDLLRWVKYFPIAISMNPALVLIELEDPGFVYGLTLKAFAQPNGIVHAQFMEGAGILAATGGLVAIYQRTDQSPSAYGGIALPTHIRLYRNGLAIETHSPSDPKVWWSAFESLHNMIDRCRWSFYDKSIEDRRFITAEELLSHYKLYWSEAQETVGGLPETITDEDSEEMARLAADPATDAQTLDELLRMGWDKQDRISEIDSQWWLDHVERVVLQNPNCSASTLEQFVEFYPDDVSYNMALPMIEMEHPGFVLNLSRTLRRLMEDFDPPDTLLRFFHGKGCQAAIGPMVQAYRKKKRLPYRDGRLPDEFFLYRNGNLLVSYAWIDPDDSADAIAMENLEVFCRNMKVATPAELLKFYVKMKLPSFDDAVGAIDPETTPEALEELAKEDLLAALAHPNASREQIGRWLQKYYDYFEWLWIDDNKYTMRQLWTALEDNPSVPLLFMESPQGGADPFLCYYFAVQMEVTEEDMLKRFREINALRPCLEILLAQMQPLLEAAQAEVPILDQRVKLLQEWLQTGVDSDAIWNIAKGKSQNFLVDWQNQLESAIKQIAEAITAESKYRSGVERLRGAVWHASAATSELAHPKTALSWMGRQTRVRFALDYLKRLHEIGKGDTMQGNESIGAGKTLELWRPEDRGVALRLAQDPATPTETLETIAQEAILQNPNCAPTRLLKHMTDDYGDNEQEPLRLSICENIAIPMMELEQPGFVYQLVESMADPSLSELSYETMRDFLQGAGIHGVVGDLKVRYIGARLPRGSNLPQVIEVYQNGLTIAYPKANNEDRRDYDQPMVFPSFYDFRHCEYIALNDRQLAAMYDKEEF